ncbi:MAG: type II toxin-antitoxin system HicA family toxin [Pseudonocardia sp.]|nr:type II toxin-antitoxin system HicA family toxin [Pseudonocardia sp.]
MPRTVSEVIKLLEADGWRLLWTRGSHRQFVHPKKVGRVTVAGKLSTDVPQGTERNNFRQAGIEWRRR